jgi:ubiquinol-cytochrome c reductase cytochrome b subunit
VSVFLMAFTAIVFFAPEFGGYFLEYNNFIPADPLQTPLHIAPVWYFTPFYSMLRAITGEMAAVLALIALVSALLASRAQPFMIKIGLWGLGAALAVGLGLLPVLSGWLSLSGILAPLFKALPWVSGIDAKFWGVVIMGGAVIILFFLPWLDNCQVKSIRYRPDWHLWMYVVFVINFLILGYLGVQAPSPVGERVSQVGTLFYFGFFLLMPWWSRWGQCKAVPDRVVFAAH